MDRRDEHLPEDFRDVEDALRAARPTISPIEADELQQRVASRVQTTKPGGQGRITRWRRRSVAIALTSGLMLTGTASVVMATGGGGGYSWPDPHHPPDSGGCQYHKSWTSTWSYYKNGVKFTVTVSYDCKTGKFTGTIVSSKPISYYYCKGKTVTVSGSTKTTTFDLAPGLQTVSVTSGGVTQSFTLPLFVYSP